MKNLKPKFTGCFFTARSKDIKYMSVDKNMNNTSITPRFEGYCYNFQNFGHRAYECRSQTRPYWTNKSNNYTPNDVCSKCHNIGHSRKNCRT